MAIHLEERQHRDERNALVAVQKRLPLGNTVRKHCSLTREVGPFVVRMNRRPSERALQTMPITQLSLRVGNRAADDRRIEPKTSSRSKYTGTSSPDSGTVVYTSGLCASGS